MSEQICHLPQKFATSLSRELPSRVEILPTLRHHLENFSALEPGTLSFEMALDNITRVDTMRTMFINLKPAAIFGVIELVAGIGEAWSYIDREFLGGSEIGEKWLMILAGRRTLAEFWIQLRLRRLQSFVNTRFEEGKTLLRTLGFKFEGNMPQYFENGDAAERWAICRGQ